MEDLLINNYLLILLDLIIEESLSSSDHLLFVGCFSQYIIKTFKEKGVNIVNILLVGILFCKGYRRNLAQFLISEDSKACFILKILFPKFQIAGLISICGVEHPLIFFS